MIHPTHQRFHDLVTRYGTAEESQESQRILDLMAEMDDGSGQWQRLTEVQLPGALVLSAAKVALSRRSRHRTYDQEKRNTEGQYAAAIMLGLEIPHSRTATQCYTGGNLGGGISAFVAKTGADSMFVPEWERDSRRVVLITGNDTHRYQFGGWIRAGEAKQPAYAREFVRGAVRYEGFIVPMSMLHPVDTWRD